MSSSKAEGKRSLKEVGAEEEDEDDEEDTIAAAPAGPAFADEDQKIKAGKGSSAGAGSMPPVTCQADSCAADLTDAKRYHRRHKVCELHANAPFVLLHGIHQRFCQQCSRFHELSEFDSSKKSCRRRLAGHNERRRKSSSDYHGEGFN